LIACSLSRQTAASPAADAVDPQARLADVLHRIDDRPASRLHERLPWNWKAWTATRAG
jgi:hypothetical protein